MSEKQEFEKYPALTEIIQHFACHVPVRLDEWTTLLVEINNALEAASQPPAIDLEKIPFDPNRLKQMEGHEERAEKSWEEIQKRLSQPPAVKGIDATPFESNTERHSVTGLTTGEYELAFIPCASDDPRRIGAYQSTDGESEFSVRELHLPVEPKGVIEWVYTAQGLPKDGDIVFVEYKDGDCGHIEYLEAEREWFTKKIHRWLNESDESPTAAGGGKEAMESDGQVQLWKKKAQKWDALDEKIGAFYGEEDCEEEKEGDLGDIGEIAAMAFGYL